MKRTNAPKLEVEIPTLNAKNMEKDNEKNNSGSVSSFLKNETNVVRKIEVMVSTSINVFSSPDINITAFPLSHKKGRYNPATKASGSFFNKPVGVASVIPISNECPW